MINGTERPFDLVIFGASGFTGQCVIEYVIRAVEEDFKKPSGEITQKLRWVGFSQCIIYVLRIKLNLKLGIFFSSQEINDCKIVLL